MPSLPKLQDGVLSYRGRSAPVEEASGGIAFDRFQIFRGGTRMWVLTRAGVRIFSLPDLKLMAFHHGARSAFVKDEILGILTGQGDQSLIRWDNRKFGGKRLSWISDISSDGSLILRLLNGRSQIIELGREFRILKTWSNAPGNAVEGPIERLSRREFVCSSMGALDLYFDKYRLNPDGTISSVALSEERYYVPEGVWLPSWIGGDLICHLTTHPSHAQVTPAKVLAQYSNRTWHFQKQISTRMTR